MTDREPVNLAAIVRFGNPVLRQRATPVGDPRAPKWQHLADRLLATCRAAHGVGLAAPQLGVSARAVVVASRPNLRYPGAPTMEPTAMFDPHILARSADVAKDWEGCLSVDGVRGLVPRHAAIEVAYFDRHGQRQQRELVGFVARIFQHELDHLNGIVFLDRVESLHELATETEYLTFLKARR